MLYEVITLFVDVRGEAVGQVNGLAVYGAADYAFGRPSRITASVGMGREGIINIEREAELSGPTHNKGVLILSGWLRRTFVITSYSIHYTKLYDLNSQTTHKCRQTITHLPSH